MGIVIDDIIKFFFQSLMDKKLLVSLYDFENCEGIFFGVYCLFKFCMLIVSGEKCFNNVVQFVFFVLNVDEVCDFGKVFSFFFVEIVLLNFNICIVFVFCSSCDVVIMKGIYQCVFVLFNEVMGENFWGISFK